MTTEAASLWQDLGGGSYVMASNATRALVNIGLVVGTRRALVVDTGCGPVHAADILVAVRAVTLLPLVVVNTHGHWDHFFGNAAFVRAGVTDIWAHEKASRFIERTAERQRVEALLAEPATKDDSRLVLPTHEVGVDGAELDLGALTVQLFTLGPAHTDHDLLVGAPGVLFAGDILEEGGEPDFEDAEPTSWLKVLQRLTGMGDKYPVMVPGHGRPVNAEFPAAMARHMLDTAAEC